MPSALVCSCTKEDSVLFSFFFMDRKCSHWKPFGGIRQISFAAFLCRRCCAFLSSVGCFLCASLCFIFSLRCVYSFRCAVFILFAALCLLSHLGFAVLGPARLCCLLYCLLLESSWVVRAVYVVSAGFEFVALRAAGFHSYRNCVHT